MNTTTVREEMAKVDMNTVLQEMSKFAEIKLSHVDIKQFEGRTTEDYVSDTILRVLEGSRDWNKAKTNNYKEFLFGCLRSEISNLQKKITRRDIKIDSLRSEYARLSKDDIHYLKLRAVNVTENYM